MRTRAHMPTPTTTYTRWLPTSGGDASPCIRWPHVHVHVHVHAHVATCACACGDESTCIRWPQGCACAPQALWCVASRTASACQAAASAIHSACHSLRLAPGCMGVRTWRASFGLHLSVEHEHGHVFVRQCVCPLRGTCAAATASAHGFPMMWRHSDRQQRKRAEGRITLVQLQG